jgi:hypothetical protein
MEETVTELSFILIVISIVLILINFLLVSIHINLLKKRNALYRAFLIDLSQDISSGIKTAEWEFGASEEYLDGFKDCGEYVIKRLNNPQTGWFNAVEEEE